MACEAIPCLVETERTAHRLFYRCWDHAGLSNGEVEVLNRLIVADTTFIKLSVVAQNKSLTDLAATNTIEDRLRNRFFTIGDTVDICCCLHSGYRKGRERVASRTLESALALPFVRRQRSNFQHRQSSTA